MGLILDISTSAKISKMLRVIGGLFIWCEEWVGKEYWLEELAGAMLALADQDESFS